ncbi:hypothetical protein D3C85_884330 [compost metagenome]
MRLMVLPVIVRSAQSGNHALVPSLPSRRKLTVEPLVSPFWIFCSDSCGTLMVIRVASTSVSVMARSMAAPAFISTPTVCSASRPVIGM